MQYVGRALGTVSKTWSSLNPSTLSGAIDVIVVEHEDGQLFCSPFHVRFGKFQLLRPSEKKVIFVVNGEPTDIPMKLGDGGEAFFVFETDADVPSELRTSPVISAQPSPGSSPRSSVTSWREEEPDYLNIGEGAHDETPPIQITPSPSRSATSLESPKSPRSAVSMERAQNISTMFIQKNIPSTVEDNGDVLLDMQGYKSNDTDMKNSDEVVKQLLNDEFGPDIDYNALIDRDLNGNIRILNSNEDILAPELLTLADHDDDSRAASMPSLPLESEDEDDGGTVHFKTLRLTSEQLKCLALHKGRNEIEYRVGDKSIIRCNLFLWDWNVPIVISDIDGTITKSDALGHVFAMIGKDWTHEGVAGLFSDINSNGYNIMYLTARSVGLADTTRSYLLNVEQDGYVLPSGPVILSPDRTIEALRRELVLKKPQVFKMSCLKDIEELYFPENAQDDSDINTNTNPNTGETEPSEATEKEVKTPFYAGFGNRITDALSYRTVGVPSSRIFTINTVGEVHMELLEMAGYKASYVSIGELVDQFFPPVNLSAARKGQDIVGLNNTTNQFSDVNFWRDPIKELDDLSSISGHSDSLEEEGEEAPSEPTESRPVSPRLKSFFLREPEPVQYEDDLVEDDLDEDPNYVYESEEENYEDEDEDDGDDGIDHPALTPEAHPSTPVRNTVSTNLGLEFAGGNSSSPASTILDAQNIEGSLIGLPDQKRTWGPETSE